MKEKNHSKIERSKLGRIFADEKLRRVLRIKHRICKYNDYYELGHVETKGIEISTFSLNFLKQELAKNMKMGKPF